MYEQTIHVGDIVEITNPGAVYNRYEQFAIATGHPDAVNTPGPLGPDAIHARQYTETTEGVQGKALYVGRHLTDPEAGSLAVVQADVTVPFKFIIGCDGLNVIKSDHVDREAAGMFLAETLEDFRKKFKDSKLVYERDGQKMSLEEFIEAAMKNTPFGNDLKRQIITAGALTLLYAAENYGSL